MRNAVESGKRFYVTLTSDVQSGEIIVVGALIGVALNGGKAGDEIVCERRLVTSQPKAAGAVSQGDKAYLVADDKKVTKTATGNTLVGCFFRAAAADAAEAEVLID